MTGQTKFGLYSIDGGIYPLLARCVLILDAHVPTMGWVNSSGAQSSRASVHLEHLRAHLDDRLRFLSGPWSWSMISRNPKHSCSNVGLDIRWQTTQVSAVHGP